MLTLMRWAGEILFSFRFWTLVLVPFYLIFG